MVYIQLIDNSSTFIYFDDIINYDEIIKMNYDETNHKTLPDSIKKLVNLQVLNCSKNGLSYLSKFIG